MFRILDPEKTRMRIDQDWIVFVWAAMYLLLHPLTNLRGGGRETKLGKGDVSAADGLGAEMTSKKPMRQTNQVGEQHNYQDS